MTQGKRAAPRRRFVAGYWADETMPDNLPAILDKDIEVKAFASWFGPRLADYRGALEMANAFPDAATSAAVLMEVEAALQSVQKVLRPDAIPPRARAMIEVDAHRLGLSFHEAAREVQLSAVSLLVLVARTRKRLEAVTVKRGRPGKESRNALFAELVTGLRERHGQKAAVARSLAGKILIACGVCGVPGDEAIRKAVRKTGKK